MKLILIVICILLISFSYTQRCDKNHCNQSGICRSLTNNLLGDGNGGNCVTNCNDTSKCRITGTNNCVSLDGMIRNSSGFCSCQSNFCLNKSSKKCINKAGSVNLTTDNDGFCKCSNTSQCFDPFNTHLCLTSEEFKAVSDGGQCECANSAQCMQFDLTSRSSCVNLSATTIKGIDSLCVNKCSTGQCWVPSNGNNPNRFQCIIPNSNVNLNSNGNCSCSTSQCFDSEELICLTKNANGLEDSSVCRCSDNTMCLSHISLTCIVPNTNFTPTSGYRCGCTNNAHCYKNDTSDCAVPESNFSSNYDGKSCFTFSGNRKCSVLTKCLDNSYANNYNYCIDPTNLLKATTTGGDCECESTSNCISNGVCRISANTFISNNDGKRCYNNQCPGNSITNSQAFNDCYDEETYKCTQRDGTLKNQNMCQCLSNRKCFNYNLSKVQCVDPSSTNISDSDGKKCQSLCTNRNNCYHPFIFLCQNGKSGFNTGGVCARNQIVILHSFKKDFINFEKAEISVIYDLDDLTMPTEKNLCTILRNDLNQVTYHSEISTSVGNYWNNFIPSMSLSNGQNTKFMVISDIRNSCNGRQPGMKSYVKFYVQYFTCQEKMNSNISLLNAASINWISFNQQGVKINNSGNEQEYISLNDKLIGHDILTCQD